MWAGVSMSCPQYFDNLGTVRVFACHGVGWCVFAVTFLV